jgi:hypothetical protein
LSRVTPVCSVRIGRVQIVTKSPRTARARERRNGGVFIAHPAFLHRAGNVTEKMTRHGQKEDLNTRRVFMNLVLYRIVSS